MVLADFVKGVAAGLFTVGGGFAIFYMGSMYQRGTLLETTCKPFRRTGDLAKYVYNDYLVPFAKTEFGQLCGISLKTLCFGGIITTPLVFIAVKLPRWLK